MQSHQQTKYLVVLSMITVLSYLSLILIRIPLTPIAPFLKYDMKDVLITIGGFLCGPISVLVTSFTTSFLQMITISETGPIGLLMNSLSTICFACTASIIYKIRKNLLCEIVGLLSGCSIMTLAMLVWNYWIVPFYTGASRESIIAMLIPIFLPFNLAKGLLNALIIIMLYKPICSALHKLNINIS